LQVTIKFVVEPLFVFNIESKVFLQVLNFFIKESAVFK